MNFIKRFRTARQAVEKIRLEVSRIPDSWSHRVVSEDWNKEFESIWKLLKPSLELGKTLVGRKLVPVIEELIIIGDEIATLGAAANRKSKFIRLLKRVWPSVRQAPIIAMSFTNDKVDSVLARVVAWGDLIAEQHVTD